MMTQYPSKDEALSLMVETLQSIFKSLDEKDLHPEIRAMLKAQILQNHNQSVEWLMKSPKFPD